MGKLRNTEQLPIEILAVDVSGMLVDLRIGRHTCYLEHMGQKYTLADVGLVFVENRNFEQPIVDGYGRSSLNSGFVRDRRVDVIWRFVRDVAEMQHTGKDLAARLEAIRGAGYATSGATVAALDTPKA